MSDVIDFLERMGQNAPLQHASRDELECVLAEVEMEPAMRLAILAKDSTQVQDLLDQTPMFIIVMPSEEPEEEEEEEGDEPGESEEGPAPKKDGQKNSLHSSQAMATSD